MILEDITMTDFEEGLKRTRTVYIPFGSVEEHGNHLPLSTDTVQAYEIGKAASDLIPMFVAPPVHYGCCRSTSGHPGTITIRTSTLKALFKDIVVSMEKMGLKNFIVVTGHAGGTHTMALQDAGEELIAELTDIRIALITEYELVKKVGTGIIETEGDCHAGEIETSRMLHYRPELVKQVDRYEFPEFPRYILVRDKRRYWKGGVWGDPTKASTQKGVLLHDAVVAKLVEIVRATESFTE